MIKKAFIVGIVVILIIIGITLYLFPCKANVESIKVFSLNEDTGALNYWLKKSKWDLNPQMKYARLFYTVSIQPYLPFSFQFENILPVKSNGNFNILLVEPTIPHNENECWWIFKKRHLQLNVVVEYPKNIGLRELINGISFSMQAYRFVKNPEWEKNPQYNSPYISYPTWPTIRIEVPKDLEINVN